ncbi:MAG: putative Na+/H+ antiporter [Pseudobdellovibrionaceae bacterium]
MIQSHQIEVLGALVFAVAILHTFCASLILKFSHRFPKGSGREALFHLLGEVEVVFGFWAAILMVIFSFWQGPGFAVDYQSSLNFTEPIFIFCIMIVAATRPILEVVEKLIHLGSSFLEKVFYLSKVNSDFLMILILGPLAGSLITEPAAMTVTALLLSVRLHHASGKMIYFLLGVLFVNVSIGGALTPFAAPPILMVASKWGWDLSYVFTNLGWKSIVAVSINAVLFVGMNSKKIEQACKKSDSAHIPLREAIPLWVTVIHLLFLAGIVLAAHHASMALGIFLLFLGLSTVTKRYQNILRIRESLLVAFFLAGIVMFGPFQKWWLEPLLTGLNHWALYAAAAVLTAVTDNAALTYLGSQVDGLSEISRYYLVAGAIAGGGLTIIANAPNAAGYSVLQRFFPDGLNPVKLFVGALIPTAIALIFLGIGSF